MLLDGDAPKGATVDETAAVFKSLLSAESEDPKERETPPAPKTPEPVESEPDAAEQAVADTDESSETEQPETAETETPESTDIDPSMKVRTKVDGQEIEVTLDEALKGYSRTQDYTRKTQELSERRKAFETEAQAVRAERVQVAEYLKNLEQVIAEVTPQEPDWAQLQQENPAAFPTEWAKWQQHKQEVGEVQRRRQEAEQLVSQDRAQQHQAHLTAERQKLVELIPEWKDAATAKAEKAKLVSYATKAGWTDQDLSQVTDSRAISMLLKAMRYDELVAKKPVVQAKIERVKTATPGPAGANRPPVSDATRALQRLAKTGKREDAAAAFRTMLGD